LSDHPDVKEAKEIIRKTIQDPVTRLLTNHSQLTLAQLETLLAATLSDENSVSKSQRKFYCPSRSHISRGSYNRSLIQAQNNIIRSIYTVLVLGYVRLFDSATLQPFLELSDAIQSYVDEAKTNGADGGVALKDLNSKLFETVEALAKRHSFKDKL
jgi:hypothetical protein